MYTVKLTSFTVSAIHINLICGKHSIIYPYGITNNPFQSTLYNHNLPNTPDTGGRLSRQEINNTNITMQCIQPWGYFITNTTNYNAMYKTKRSETITPLITCNDVIKM